MLYLYHEELFNFNCLKRTFFYFFFSAFILLFSLAVHYTKQETSHFHFCLPLSTSDDAYFQPITPHGEGLFSSKPSHTGTFHSHFIFFRNPSSFITVDPPHLSAAIVCIHCFEEAETNIQRRCPTLQRTPPWSVTMCPRQAALRPASHLRHPPGENNLSYTFTEKQLLVQLYQNL